MLTKGSQIEAVLRGCNAQIEDFLKQEGFTSVKNGTVPFGNFVYNDYMANNRAVQINANSTAMHVSVESDENHPKAFRDFKYRNFEQFQKEYKNMLQFIQEVMK